MNDADLRFALTKAPATVEYAVANLRRGGVPLLRRAFAPAVLVVGAGPTLDLDRVAAAHAAGVSIWTTNTAARAVCSVCSPDVVVIRESLDVGDHLDGLEHAPALIAVDLHAHPSTWQSPYCTAFFVPATVQSFALAAALDTAPVYAGVASLTAAVALAEAGGATWIGLEGVDLAYGRDGSAYAPGARYAARIARVDGNVATLTGGDEQRELAAKSGQVGPGNEQPVRLVHAREGAPLHALATWVDQVEWLERFAARRPKRGVMPTRGRGLGLCDLVGWPEDERSWEAIARDVDTLHDATWFHADTREPDPARVAAILADVARQCDLATAVADAVEAGRDPTLLADLTLGACLVETHAAGRMQLAIRGDDAIAGVCAALRESAARLAAS